MSFHIIVNPGSASKKYALYDGATKILSLHFEQLEGSYQLTVSGPDMTQSTILNEGEYSNALQYVLSTMQSAPYMSAGATVAAIGVRIVAPGSFFQAHKKIDAEYIRMLEKRRDEDPVHIGPLLNEIRGISQRVPDVPIVGLSDSAFHANMPNRARSYAIDTATAEAHDIIRFGYHGLSFASVVQTLRSRGTVPEKIVICHLGSGASISALRHGECIDTSMGCTPLEGLVMATRVGDIDAGAVIRIARGSNFSLDDLEQYLYTQCGLKGLSGTSDDIRELLKFESAGDERAVRALDTYVYRIQKYIGAYAAALGGLDMLVLTGTVGERSAIIRARVCENLNYLGIECNTEKNDSAMPTNGILEIGVGRTAIIAMQSKEMEEMSRIVELDAATS